MKKLRNIFIGYIITFKIWPWLMSWMVPLMLKTHADTVYMKSDYAWGFKLFKFFFFLAIVAVPIFIYRHSARKEKGELLRVNFTVEGEE